MRFFSGFLTGGVLGFVGGLVVMLIIFPFLFPPPMVNEKVDDDLELLFTGAFREGVPGQDVAHWGRGEVKVYEHEDDDDKVFIELQSDFEVGAGPNFWLYLNSKNNIDHEEDFTEDEDRVRLTKLKSFQGSQVYEVDAEDYKDAGALTIWCESFGQYIASANLKF